MRQRRSDSPWARLVLAAAAASSALLLLSSSARAQHDAHAHAPGAHGDAKALKLGTVKWPNSGAPAAQEPFLRGVALLHSFEYRDARDAFRQARQADPTFALAYWAEALTESQFMWGVEDIPAARAALARLAPTADARLARAKSPRERAFGAAVESFFTDGQPLERARRYADAMKAYAAAAPDDIEAAAFASHAQMVGAIRAPGAEAVARYEDAIAFAEKVFAASPDHPGGAHYLIHATDSPRFAERGLAAARAYDKIAPDADHALHMPSHIFLQLGMWDETVASNERSWPAGRAWAARRKLGVGELGWHSLEWLQYGYLQQGRYDRARALIDTARALVSRADAASLGPYPDVRHVVTNLAFHYGAETGRWDAFVPVALPPGDTTSIRARSMATAGRYRAAVAALRGRGDTATALEAARQLRGGATAPASPGSPTIGERMAAQLEGMVAERRGDLTAAIALYERAAEGERAPAAGVAPVGPPWMIPAIETLADALLAAGRAKDAAAAYALALERRPGRSRALLGLARAHAAAGDTVAAADARARLLANWKKADRAALAMAESIGAAGKRGKAGSTGKSGGAP